VTTSGVVTIVPPPSCSVKRSAEIHECYKVHCCNLRFHSGRGCYNDTSSLDCYRDLNDENCRVGVNQRYNISWLLSLPFFGHLARTGKGWCLDSPNELFQPGT